MFSRKHSLSLTGAIQGYLADIGLAGRTRATQVLYRGLLLRLARSIGPERHINTIRREHVAQYLSCLKERDSQSYVCLNVRVFKCFFAWLMAQGEIRESPLADMTAKEPPWTPVSPFTPNECQRLLSAADSSLERLVVLLLLDTGLRASELTGLQVEDIDLDLNELAIVGKGGKQRRVALNPRPRKALLAHLMERAQVDGQIWPSGWKRQQLAYLLDKIGRRAGVARCHAHRFRHTWASAFLRETGDALALQQLLGHSSLIMVQRYTAALEEERSVQVHKQHSVIPAA